VNCKSRDLIRTLIVIEVPYLANSDSHKNLTWPPVVEKTHRKAVILAFLCARLSGSNEPIYDCLKNLIISLEQCEE
jgi:hypothetical protein